MYIVIAVGGLNNALPDAAFPTLASLFPKYDPIYNGEGELTGKTLVPDATFEDRILSNWLADTPFWTKADQCTRVATSFKKAGPAMVIPQGQQENFHVIPISGIEDWEPILIEVANLRAAVEASKGPTVFPEGRIVNEFVINKYLDGVLDT